jgi:hypothetical protein
MEEKAKFINSVLDKIVVESDKLNNDCGTCICDSGGGNCSGE